MKDERAEDVDGPYEKTGYVIFKKYGEIEKPNKGKDISKFFGYTRVSLSDRTRYRVVLVIGLD